MFLEVGEKVTIEDLLYGIAVVSAIFAQENIREAAAELRQIAREVVGNED